MQPTTINEYNCANIPRFYESKCLFSWGRGPGSWVVSTAVVTLFSELDFNMLDKWERGLTGFPLSACDWCSSLLRSLLRNLTFCQVRMTVVALGHFCREAVKDKISNGLSVKWNISVRNSTCHFCGIYFSGAANLKENMGHFCFIVLHDSVHTSYTNRTIFIDDRQLLVRV